MSELNYIPIITLDGLSGSGKGTISALLAKKLKWHFLDSGIFYRALAWKAQHHQLDFNQLSELIKLAQNLNLTFAYSANNQLNILLDQEDITISIRLPQCATFSSKISVYPEIRTILLAKQRAFAKFPGLVADGRDMGTVVFPDAILKFYLTATLTQRANRRYLQLKAQGINVSLDELRNELSERDQRDRMRPIAPSLPALDAIIVDTSELSIDQLFTKLLAQVVAKGIAF